MLDMIAVHPTYRSPAPFVYNIKTLDAMENEKLPVFERVRQFVKAHPNVTVKINTIPPNYNQDMASHLLKQINADIVEVVPNELVWGDAQLFADLSAQTLACSMELTIS